MHALILVVTLDLMGCRKLSKNFLRVSYKKGNTEKKRADYSPYGSELILLY